MDVLYYTHTTNNKVGICAGRWQPWHLGHEWHLGWSLKQFSKVVLTIINPDPKHPPVIEEDWAPFSLEMNPMNYWERYRILWNYFTQKGIIDRLYFAPAWHPNRNLSKESTFLPPIEKRVWTLPIVKEHDFGKEKSLSSQGEEVITTMVPEDYLKYEATYIRNLIKQNNDKWQDFIPSEVVDQLFELRIIERIKTENKVPAYDPKEYNVYYSSFQPFDNIDATTINSLLKTPIQLVIMVSNTSLANYFTYWERIGIINTYLKAIKQENKVMIVPYVAQSYKSFLPDRINWNIRTDEYNTDFVDRILNIYDQVNFIKCIDFTNTDLQRLIYEGKKYESLIPESLINQIATLLSHRKNNIKIGGSSTMDKNIILKLNAEIQSLANSLNKMDADRERGLVNQQDYMLMRNDFDRKKIQCIDELSVIIRGEFPNENRLIEILESYKYTSDNQLALSQLLDLSETQHWSKNIRDIISKNKANIIDTIVKITLALAKNAV